MQFADAAVTRFQGASDPASQSEPGLVPVSAEEREAASTIIEALKARPSALEPGSPYAKVAEAVIASDARVAEAELRVARLRAEAARWNWLPTVGPRISLSSLGDWVAELLVNQVIFDNGRKVAERDLALSEVEIAAVALVEDSNTRVYDALALYITAEEGRARITHYSEALKEMRDFEWVMEQRVQGGVSDLSDLNVIRQKIATIKARMGDAREQSATALAELSAMAGHPVEKLSGLGTLKAAKHGTALGVIRAEAERDRVLAQARISRASHLPGLTATATAGSGGINGGLSVGTDTLFGVGTIAEFEAIEAGTISADRKVAQAQETAARAIAAQARKLDGFSRQVTEAQALTRQARTNLEIFRAQFQGGQRQVMDVVGVYETYASALESEIDLKFRAARAELELARLQGALAEGARI